MLIFYSALAQKTKKTKQNTTNRFAVSMMYSNYIFGRESSVNDRVLIYEFFLPSSFGARTSYWFSKNMLNLSLNIELGGGKQSPVGNLLETRIENNYVKFNPNIGLRFSSSVLKGYNANIGVGGSLLYADFRLIQNTPADIKIYTNSSFLDIGANIFIESSYEFSNKIGIIIPLYFEYFPGISLITHNAGIGISLRL